ncbi:hypothetical protein EGR_07449 [Echinococcus granulosus]|uniref:Secreted protein n=1 Tax=Echinococcus granulosus TaxID=6210 RepID=W6U8R7_ECHGR|nr:hypothetical protein EGR_07449 [Echinococcus granulosus]EUB57708.1 hypothetical protein EGR_07449 [Echinococcus granulosus]
MLLFFITFAYLTKRIAWRHVSGGNKQKHNNITSLYLKITKCCLSLEHFEQSKFILSWLRNYHKTERHLKLICILLCKSKVPPPMEQPWNLGRGENCGEASAQTAIRHEFAAPPVSFSRAKHQPH